MDWNCSGVIIHSIVLNGFDSLQTTQKMKKPFSETKVGQFVDKIKPHVGNALDFVGEWSGNKAIEKIGEFLQDKKEESPELMAAHMEFEKYKLEWQLEIQRIEMEEFKLEVQDKENARSREIQFMQASGGKRDWLMGITVGVALLMYIGAFIFLAYGPDVHEQKKDLFNMGVGQVFTFAGMAFSYYLGTTKSSRIKDETISKMS